ncbi:unnamed protein product [Thelazia callipaeda]|uniref:USP domain-containing protein n=1 Tax=Thelazia callipaeda TaxID=103827 RepID=A0A0N5CQK7_THECL|nr:unnamed protein product [Thelazia callipaeda]
MTLQANELWDALIVNSVFEYERSYGFQMFGTMQEQEDIDPKALEKFFTSRILKLPVELLNEEGFSCFKIFWTVINKKHHKLIQPAEAVSHYLMCNFDLEGMDYLWDIMLQGRAQVSQMAISLWVETLANPHTSVIADFASLIQAVINNFTMLKAKHCGLIKSEINEAEKIELLDCMGRILTALKSYICAFDDDCCMPKRSQHPLRKAGLGQCFLLPIIFPEITLDSTNDIFRFPFIFIGFRNSTFDIQDDEHSIAVHSMMSLSDLKLKIDDQLRCIGGCNVGGLLTPVQLTVQRLSPPEARILQSSDCRKTLDDLGIDSATHIIVRLRNNPGIWNNGLASAESSPDHTFFYCLFNVGTAERSEGSERILPGSVIAENCEYVRFLYTLADIGCAHENNYVRKAATDVLNQIPTDTMSVVVLQEMVRSGRLCDLLPSESSNQLIHLLRVLYSLLLPCDGHCITEATDFQILFFTTPSCLAVFSFLEDPKILCLWDEYTGKAVIWWLASIAKFVSFVAARLKYLRNTNDNECFKIDQVICREQAIFKEVCCVVARDLNKRIEKDPALLQAISELLVKNSCRIECFLRLAWAAGSRSIPLRIKSGELAKDSSFEAIMQSQTTSSALVEPVEWLLDTFAIEVVSSNATSEVLEMIHLWNHVVSDLLFSRNSSVRRYFATVARRMVSISGAAERELTSALLQLLLRKLEENDDRVVKNTDFFILLCKLLDLCRSSKIHVEDVLQHLEKVLNWLERAKQHTISNQESCQDDKSLIGRLEICRSLLGFLTNEQKTMIGSEPSGTLLVKQLLDEFILPSSRAYVDLMRQRESDSSTYIQRSVTHGAISRSGEALNYSQINKLYTLVSLRFHVWQQQVSFLRDRYSLDYSRTLDFDEIDSVVPHSATTGSMLSSRCIPVCGTNESEKAAYNLLLALCDTSPLNYKCLAESLLELFYSDPITTENIEWEYMPGYSVRSPNSYVGLKNGGATCYMNSIFMIEPLRNAIINSNCTDDLNIEEKDYESICNEHYHTTILKAVQSIFAHLLGSEMQSYAPKFFWKHFRFCGQPVNVREQQDALEFYNALFDSIDEGLKKLGELPICESLFGGTFADQKICKDCPHRYQREEAFTSISVDVRSHNNLLDSLKEYVKGDLLNNDNAYLCEECNVKVTAVKRLCVARLPPYLTIQLKRFDFDWERDVPQKYNDYFEFPILLDMMPFTVYGLAQAEGEFTKEDLTNSSVTDSGRGTSVSISPETNEGLGNSEISTSEIKLNDNNTKYCLRGVVVHSGQANGGHYYSFIRSEEDGGRWFKFDDIDVTEWHLSKEEMRNMWFGGEYIAESLDNSGNHSQKRRQKRWWNAYLLIYEKTSAAATSVTSLVELTTSISAQPSHSPTSSTNSPLSLDKKISAMSISTRIRQMPPKLEALIREKNTCAMHERSQYTANYFQFIRDICSQAVRVIKQFRPEIQEDYYLLTIKLLSKFLFSTGLRAKKILRSLNIMEWQKTYEMLFELSFAARKWFICNIMFQSKIVVTYLLTAQSSEVRHFFTNVLIMLLNATVNDQADSIQSYLHTRYQLLNICIAESCLDFKFEASFTKSDSISDMFIGLLLVIPQNYFLEFSTHITQYVTLFNLYALSGIEQVLIFEYIFAFA